ncbi:putative transcriptional regulator SLK2 [Salvia divinorum]|uniref:Transcriptional regulator SLK2 n=1 Tax=Salvia divinorum TaxID=28513 RepID=A0ABD1H2Y4_SALDI
MREQPCNKPTQFKILVGLASEILQQYLGMLKRSHQAEAIVLKLVRSIVNLRHLLVIWDMARNQHIYIPESLHSSDEMVPDIAHQFIENGFLYNDLDESMNFSWKG